MTIEIPSWEIGPSRSRPKLEGDIEADIAIIGGGATGIMSAYALSKAGLKVVLVEKNKDLLQSTTLYTTAFVTKLLDTPYEKLVALFGEDKAGAVWRSGQDAVDLIADIVDKEGIDCEFRRVPAYTYAEDSKQFKRLTSEYEAVRKAGFEATLLGDGSQLGFGNTGFMEIPGQAMFHPIKFARALAERAEGAGARIFTDTEVLTIEGQTVRTAAGQVRAKDILIATYSPIMDEGTRFKKAMYVSYVYELETEKGLIPEGMYLDMNNPYHYFRVDSFPDHDRLIVGGEDHRKDIKIDPGKNFAALERYVKALLGGKPYKITRRWSGDILESVNGLALIGEIKPHIYVATGFSGNGMTYSAISSMIVRDAILGRKNVYAGLYDPKQKISLKQLGMKGLDYAGEFFGGAVKNFFS